MGGVEGKEEIVEDDDWKKIGRDDHENVAHHLTTAEKRLRKVKAELLLLGL